MSEKYVVTLCIQPGKFTQAFHSLMEAVGQAFKPSSADVVVSSTFTETQIEEGLTELRRVNPQSESDFHFNNCTFDDRLTQGYLAKNLGDMLQEVVDECVARTDCVIIITESEWDVAAGYLKWREPLRRFQNDGYIVIGDPNTNEAYLALTMDEFVNGPNIDQ